MRNAAMSIVLALLGLSVSTPAQVTVRIGSDRVVATAGAPRAHGEIRRTSKGPASRRVVRYEVVRERVWVEGYYDRVWRPAEFGFRYDSCGNRIRFVVRAAGFDRVWVPGRWEYRTRRVPVRVPSRTVRCR
ncbi:MAG: hypothetical protein KDB80_18170 [Planctomycetes bacterium]|nr:hypothetical protein [Planctomycetota bacterium]